MKIQTFENGVVVGETEVDDFIAPNWSAAKIAFLSDAGYQRITLQTTKILAVTRLETAVVDYAGGMEPTYPLFKNFWDAIIAGLAIPPTIQEINNWKAIATNTNMKFTFAADGTMILLGD
ncbi:hypothetical protein NSTC745_06418 [Nostoc sp. DSM 114161]|jgi:hypothetical protein|uniref:hypothetical protein n=1 Tax=Nostoc sp. DSM 114161 TaxID=3440143 RepID=UPI004045AA7B